MCWSSLPRGLQSARILPKSSAPKSGPAVEGLAPLRLTWMTPTTLSPERMGALTIFWMSSELSPPIFAPSKTVAWRTLAKLLIMSERLSRAAIEEVLERGIKPTCLSDSGLESGGVASAWTLPSGRFRRTARRDFWRCASQWLSGRFEMSRWRPIRWRWRCVPALRRQEGPGGYGR